MAISSLYNSHIVQTAESEDLQISKRTSIPNDDFIQELIRLLREGHMVTIKVQGHSMRPFLENNRDKVIMRKPILLNVGMIVLVQIGNGCYVVHRIIKLKADTIILRGDGNMTTENCRAEDVMGEVIAFFRKDRKKAVCTNSLEWRVYSWIWIRLFPFRKYLLWLYRRLWIP